MEELSKEDKIKETIRFNLEKLRLAVVCIITVGGGTISLIYEPCKTGAMIFFLAMGILLTVAAITRAFKYSKT